MASKSIRKNFIFNAVYQILYVLVPLIVTPYISRVLEPEGVGLYSYANSIVSYFVLVAVLGSSLYGQRSISYTQDDKEGRSRAFWEIFLFRLTTSAVTLTAYLVFSFLYDTGNKAVYLLLALNILNVVCDITWFYQGMEDFSKTATITTFFRILNVVFIFLFVKTADDLSLYVLFTVLFTILGNISFWIPLHKYVCRVKGIRPFRDVKSLIQLFLPTIATQIYLVLDKSMIGWFTEDYTQNGYYEQAEKAVRVAITFVTSLAAVMVPRIGKKFAEGDDEAIRNYLYQSYRFVWMLAIPIMFGLIAVASVFVPVFFGKGYDECITLIPVFSPLAIFIGMSYVTGLEFFVPTKRQNILTLTYIVGAVVNLILNLILIPRYYALGATIGSIAAECCVMLTGFIYVRRKKLYPLLPIVTASWKYWIAGGVMFAALWFIKPLFLIGVWSLVALIAIGVVIYFTALLLLFDSFLWKIVKQTLGMLKRLFKREKKTPSEEETSPEEKGE